MPIAFPQPNMDTVLTDVKRMSTKPFYVVPAPSMDAPNKLYTAFTFDPGKAQKALQSAIRDIGIPYRDVARTATINPAMGPRAMPFGPQSPFTAGYSFNNVMGVLNKTLSGVSRDANGARLANCQILIFRTQDKSLVAETVSDGNGDWSISMLKGGPFFFVEYKVGSPDVFGTSPNDRTPV